MSQKVVHFLMILLTASLLDLDNVFININCCFYKPFNVKVRLYNNESLSFKSNTGDGKKIMVENLENISKKFCRRRAPNIYMNLHPKSMV